MPNSRVITSVTFDKLLARLDPDRDRAGEEYEALRRRLTKYFSLKGLRVPELAADETLDRIALKIERGEDVRDFTHYAYAVAHWIFLESLRAEERERTGFDSLAQVRAANDDSAAAEHLELLQSCLKKLPADDQQLLANYYSEAVSADCAQQRLELAGKEGLTLNSLRLRVFRLRQALEGCIRRQSQ